MSRNKRRQRDVRHKPFSGSEESDSSMESTSDDGSSEGSNGDDEKDTYTRVLRPGPQRNSANDRSPSISANNRPHPNIVNNKSLPVHDRDPELLFKLSFKFTAQHVLDFPLGECKTSKVLFENPSAFYRIFDRNIKVEVLFC
ncbi:hypothetical protein BDW71DRAFT_139708 [Aspergillus fruticulosus]